MIDLTGQVAVVTGSARGIGRAIAERLACAGCRIVVADIISDAAARTAEEIRAAYGIPVLAACVNVTDKGSVEQLMQQTAAEFGRLDILVNNAGVQSYVGFEDMSLDEWNRVIQVNLTSMFLCSQSALPLMRQQGRGRIINMASMSARTGGQASPANYTTSKAGAVGLTKALARTLAPYNITVNALAPGMIDTDMIAHWSDEQRVHWERQIPLGRLGTPLDVANSVVFLASDLASYITGVVLDINGGYVMP